ncbi:MAG: ABC transporter substrate-binding protein [Clostridia bacterium]|nr:ABC transporter substrate-binding protein [Clostridia bacterium]
MTAALLLCLPLHADASVVEDSLVLCIQSTKTQMIDPLDPVERDFMSIYNIMYDGLMSINDDYLPQMNLVEDYSHSPNGKTWTFKLKKDLKFSNGSDLTADDVVATTNYILDQAKNNSGYYLNLKYFISSVSAEGDYTVVFKAERAYFGLLYALTYPILPEEDLGKNNPAGTGAYICEAFQPGHALRLVPNQYWEEGVPQVRTIHVNMRDTAANVLSAYEYSSADAIFTRSIASAQYKGGSSSLALDYRTNQLECLLMNHSAFPLNLKSVREAIRYIIDVDKIARNYYNGMVERTDTPFISGTWMYDDSLSTYFRTDPIRALSVLEADGWLDVDEDGVLERLNDEGEYVELEMNLFVYEEPDDNVRLETANYIRDTLNSCGFKVTVQTMKFTAVQQALSVGNFHLCLASYAMDVCPDAGFLLMSSNTGNYCRYRSTEMTDLCKELRKQMNQSDYQRVLFQIQRQFAEDCPFICFFYRSGTVLTRRMYTTVRDVREYELLKGIDAFRSN